MEPNLEKRSCKRFTIPEAKVRFWKRGLFSMFKGGSKPVPVRDVSKGGLSFESDDGFKPNELIDLELLVPGEDPLELKADVKWQRYSKGGTHKFDVGVAFLPFGNGAGFNEMAALEKLREYDAMYTPQTPPTE